MERLSHFWKVTYRPRGKLLFYRHWMKWIVKIFKIGQKVCLCASEVKPYKQRANKIKAWKQKKYCKNAIGYSKIKRKKEGWTYCSMRMTISSSGKLKSVEMCSCFSLSHVLHRPPTPKKKKKPTQRALCYSGQKGGVRPRCCSLQPPGWKAQEARLWWG